MNKFFLGTAALALALPAAALAAQDHDAHGARAGKVVTLADHEAKVAEHFAKLDANKDGLVTQDEMKAMHEQRMEKRKEHRGERMAERRAKMEERMKSATPEERAKFEERRAKRQEMRGERKEMRGERHAEMWAKADTNGDGALSLAEMQAQARERFTRMDKNGNGQIDADEHRGRERRGHAPRG